MTIIAYTSSSSAHTIRETKMDRLKPLLAERAVPTSQEIRDCKRVAIAAIDFGSTFCSLAYNLPHEDTVNFVELNPGQQPRVPTAILLRKQRGASGIPELTIQDFGFDAQNRTTKLLDEERPDHIYFELVKMLLYKVSLLASNKPLLMFHFPVIIRTTRVIVL